MKLSDLSDDDVIAAAMRGDRDAAGEYFVRHLPFLRAMSRRIAGASVDPDDLLADAVTAVLTRWFEGRGPASHVNGYVIRSMRNRLVDETRSPHRRVLSLSVETEPAAEEPSEYRRVEMYEEASFARRALARLPEVHRTVLTALLVDGRKAGDLQHELGRPAGAIYSIIKRAKHDLRRTMLRAVLEDRAPSECRRHSGSLPTVVSVRFDDVVDATDMPHIRACPRCRAAWSRFADVALVLD